MSIVEDPVLPLNEAVGDKKPEAAASKETKTKKVSAPKKRNPPYFEMIKDAIVSLGDRSGSSQYAITKFIEDKQKNLPPNFRKLLLIQLKKFVSNEKLVKLKSSYKLPPSRSSKPAAAKPKPIVVATTKGKKAIVSKAKPKAKTAAAKSKTKVVAKPKSATRAKGKPAPKRQAPEKPKTDKIAPAKVAKTSTRSTPRRSAAATTKKETPVKKAPARSVKPKTVKSPRRKAAALKKGKN